MKKISLVALIALLFSGHAQARSKLHVNEDKLIYVLLKIENPENSPFLVGDTHLKNKAIGPLQIRLPCLSDVNWIVGRKEMSRVWGKSRLGMKDMNDFRKARWVCLVYVYYWGEMYARQTGKEPTLEVYTRIFNGGPAGWKKENTRCYGLAAGQFAREYEKGRVVHKT